MVSDNVFTYLDMELGYLAAVYFFDKNSMKPTIFWESPSLTDSEVEECREIATELMEDRFVKEAHPYYNVVVIHSGNTQTGEYIVLIYNL